VYDEEDPERDRELEEYELQQNTQYSLTSYLHPYQFVIFTNNEQPSRPLLYHLLTFLSVGR